MSIVSPSLFILVFMVSTVLYFAISPRYRWLILLFASCFFYLTFVPAYFLLLFTVIFINYVSSHFMERSEASLRKSIFVFTTFLNYVF